MQSKNKRAMTAAEREHVARVKEMDCSVCGAAGPSDAHELEQGFWFTSIPLCKDCHQGGFNGIHGQKRIWNVLKKTEHVMDLKTFVLRNELNCRQLYAHLKKNWLAMAQANKPLAVTVEEHRAKRSGAQNRLYWHLLADIAENCWVGGKRFSKEAWHAHFAGEFIGWEELPGGRRAPISTTTLSVPEFTAYVERVQAYAATELALEEAA